MCIVMYCSIIMYRGVICSAQDGSYKGARDGRVLRDEMVAPCN